MLTRHKRRRPHRFFKPRKRTGTNALRRHYSPGDFAKQVGTVRIPRLFPEAVKTFRQFYIPPTNDISINGNMSYTSSTGGLSGPGTAATGDGFFSFQVNLQSTPQFATLDSLFDQYRIESWTLMFIPLHNQIQLSGASGSNPSGQSQLLETVIDYDDQALLVTGNALLQYDTYKVTQPWVKHQRTFCPMMQNVTIVNANPSGVGFGTKFPYENNWLDCGTPGVSHYGIKGRIASSLAAANNIQSQYWVKGELVVSCRQTR